VTDGTFSRKISKALGSRFATHLELAVDLDEWCAWAIDNQVPSEIIGFLRLRPELLHHFDAKAQGHSFPCPRVWANVGQFLGKLPVEAELPFFAGALGFGAAAEFTSFLEVFRDLPDIESIMLDPDTSVVPQDYFGQRCTGLSLHAATALRISGRLAARCPAGRAQTGYLQGIQQLGQRQRRPAIVIQTRLAQKRDACLLQYPCGGWQPDEKEKP
jgi:hypothetical protein